jgi:hypothetical protein
MAPNPHQNHLLDALPKGDYDRIAAGLEFVPMQLGDERMAMLDTT